ncbi:MAG: LytR C-terminal domain-containing protein, partial [Nitriliruptorales bacterium]|nr:LytR C-terminal domain-containing protein [Nitriliruptorales bacterium]
SNRLDATPVAGLAPVIDGEPTNTLVVHTDELDSDQLLSAAVVQTGRDEPVVLALPLDLEVTVPGAESGRVRDVFAAGGRDRLVAAVSDYTGLPLHRVVHLSLSGLDRLAAVLAPDGCPEGGCLGAGEMRRDGRLPVAAVSDHVASLQRLAAEAGRPGLLLSPWRAKRVVDAVPAALATTDEFGPRAAMQSVDAFGAADLSALEVRSVPGFHDPGAGLTRPYPERAETLFQALREGSPLPADVGQADPRDELLVPERVRVLVLNGVGIEGLAGTVAETLASAGFDVAGAENAEEFDDALTATVIRHRPDRGFEGELVAGSLPGATLEPRNDLPRGVDVVVLVGSDMAD